MDFWCNQEFRDNFFLVVMAITLWSVPWKAMALWKSARNSEKWWFVIFIIINTAGLLEIFYLFLLPKIKNKRKFNKSKPDNFA